MKLKISKNAVFRLSNRMVDNIYHWEGKGDFRLEYLSDEPIGNKGGNSAVFKLVNTAEEKQVLIIKFLKFALTKTNKLMNDRFQREIDALNLAKEKGFMHVIQIHHDGYYKHEKNGQKYRYYIMEKADEDLGSFILKKENSLTVSQKISLCYNIIKGINELHSIEIYHRDIKPDNIFLFYEEEKPIWKIGDLGLLSKRGEDLLFEKGKKIGPANWLSPEAMNNALCGKTAWEHRFDTTIDEKSDVFQLGNVIWFVFNHNAPVGQVSIDDFHIKEYVIFCLIFTMLRHRKRNRKSLLFYENYFLKLDELYLLKRGKTSKWFTNKCKKILRVN